MTAKKIMRNITVIIIVNVVLLELFSFLGIQAIGLIKPETRLDLFLDKHFDGIDETYLSDKVAKSFDPDLGWDNKPLSRRSATNKAGRVWRASFAHDGAREDSLNHGRLMITTFGDSYTAGIEVDNHETWQHYLGREVGGEVKNFGVAAYSVTQSFMKMTRHLEEGFSAPTTMLVILSDSLPTKYIAIST